MAQQVAAAPPPVTVNTAQECCPPPSIWDFLGVGQIVTAVGKVIGFVGNIPIVQSLSQSLLGPAAAAAGLKPSPAAGGFSPPPGAAPSPAGPPPAAPGVGPPGPDGLPGPPPPPSAAEAAMMIDADQAAAPAKIAAIRYLARQDCACYPEVTAALLGELDNCVEEVRYEALKALHGACKPGICELPQSDEPKRLGLLGKREKKEVYACGPDCPRCACQVQVIERLSDLLLERDVTGARKERSVRVRRLAIMIIQECLGQMPPRSDVPAPEPDPVPMPTPDPAPGTAPPPAPVMSNRRSGTIGDRRTVPVAQSAMSRMHSERLRQALAATALDRVGTPIDARMADVGTADVSESAIVQVSWDVDESSPEAILAEIAQSREQPEESGLATERRVVELATQVIAQTHADRAQEDQFHAAVHHLLEARMQLALHGEEKDVDALHSDADALYRRAPQSRAAAEAAFALVRYTRLVAEAQDGDAHAWRDFAGQARNFAVNFPHDAERAGSQLFAAGWHCGRHGQQDDAVSCHQLLLQTFPDSEFAEPAQLALGRLTAPHDPIELAGAIAQHEAQIASGALPQVPPPGEDDYYALPEMDMMEFPGVPEMNYLPGETFERALEAVNTDLFLAANSLINIGTERAAISTFEMDWARPGNVFRIRFETAFDYFRPDRNEYFWARIGGNGPPLPETSLNYTELRLYSETGTDTMSGFFEVPLRNVDPEVNSGSSGLGDLVIGAKSVLVRGEDYTVSSIFRTYTPTGSARRGIGRGFTALEPGVLATFRPACNTYLHGELKFLFPLGGDRDHSGVVSRYGLGLSHVLAARPLHSGPGDRFALIGSFEVVTWSFHGGLETRADGTVRSVAGVNVVNAQPGIRLMLGETFEIGVGGGIPLSKNRMHDGLVRTELRWVY